ncbi:hypothetical protein HOY82DRAFT_603018 [Tuber indicum]|nr:hypothetical protein HOY82DRAFT_603018 [Tuber indicum]
MATVNHMLLLHIPDSAEDPLSYNQLFGVEEHYSIKREKSVLVGHSAGAHIAFRENTSSGAVAAVVAEVEGIYHLGKWVEEYADYEGVEAGTLGGGRTVNGRFWWR